MRMARISGEVIPSMLLTSLSECLCFFLGALSSMPAVKVCSLPSNHLTLSSVNKKCYFIMLRYFPLQTLHPHVLLFGYLSTRKLNLYVASFHYICSAMLRSLTYFLSGVQLHFVCSVRLISGVLIICCVGNIFQLFPTNNLLPLRFYS